MKSDGTIWIDTKIDDSGMDEGFRRLRDGADDVAVSARRAGEVVNGAFSKINFNKAVANAEAQLKSLESQFNAISAEYTNALQFDDDKAAERIAAKRTRIYDQIEKAREKLAIEVAAAAEKEARAEEKESRRVIAAAEKEAAAKRQAMVSQFDGMSNSAGRFNTRLRSIVAGAFVFNVLRSGLRMVTSYFGSALMANNQFASAVYRLQGSLMVAFQPIYETVLPSLITLINWLNVAVQAVARFFSVLAGKSYKQVQQNAQALNNVAGSANKTAGSVENAGDAIKDTGKKAKEAEKYLAGFDEINRMIREDADDLSDSLGNLGDMGAGDLGLGDFKGPIFEDVELPNEWQTAIDKLAMRFKDIFFEWDNLTPENITEKLLTALTTIAGGLIGFALLGGVKGALIGMTVGAALGVVLSSLIFDGDGKLSAQELIQTLIAALGIIAGGLIGFTLGGGTGALLGAAIGVGLTLLLDKLVFDDDGTLTAEELERSLLSVLAVIGGAALGFVLGGPGGALIGATVGLGLTMALSKMEFSTMSDTPISMEELINSLMAVLLVIGGTAIGFYLGGPGGAAIGAAIGLGLSFLVLGTAFDSVQKEYDELNKKVGKWSDETNKTTEERYIRPTETGFQRLLKTMTKTTEESKNDMISNMSLAATGVETTFFQPVAKWSQQLAERLSKDNRTTAEKIVDDWERAAFETESGYILPTKEQFAEAAEWISNKFTGATTKIKESFANLPRWFKESVTRPIIDYFNELTQGIIERFNRTAQSVASAIENLVAGFNRVVQSVSSGYQKVQSSYSRATSSASAVSVKSQPTAAYSAMYYPTAEIPMLARGAVIPPNHKFLAVLGDQRTGTNIEAPLETIQEAVALVMEDVIQSNLAGHEATLEILRQILEAILGIELDGETLSRAIEGYNRKMAAARGGMT